MALAEVKGPQAGLAAIDQLDLDGYYLYHAAKADLLTRTCRHREAVAAYDAALTGAGNLAEKDFLTKRRAAALSRAGTD